MATVLVPSIDEVTVCELDGALCTRRYDDDSRAAAEKLYCRLLGKFYPTLVLDLTHEDQDDTTGHPAGGSPVTQGHVSASAQQEAPRRKRSVVGSSIPSTEGASKITGESLEASPSAASNEKDLGTSETRDHLQQGQGAAHPQHQRQQQQRHGPSRATGIVLSRAQRFTKRAVEGSMGWLGLSPTLLMARDPPHPASVTWHDRKEQLAVVDPSAEADRVLVFSLDSAPQPALGGSFPGWGSGFGRSPVAQGQAGTAQASLTLSHIYQSRVSSAAWRPFAPSTLAVGCSGGVCLWDTSSSLDSPVLTTAAANHGKAGFSINVAEAVQRMWTRQAQLARSGARFLDSSPPALQLLYPGSAAAVTSLAWDPSGRLLAGVVESQSTVHVWEAATGESTQLRHRGGQLSLLEWSPRGNCLVAVRDRSFLQVWDAQSWNCTEWEFEGHAVSGLAWAPNGQLCLISFSSTPVLRGMYVGESPAGLSFSILPAEFETSAVTTGLAQGFRGVDAMAWDPSGKRLALAFGGGTDAMAGLVGVYATELFPVFQASLVGFVRGPIREGDRSIGPCAMSFHASFPKGALLSVVWGGGVCSMYPLLFGQNFNL